MGLNKWIVLGVLIPIGMIVLGAFLHETEIMPLVILGGWLWVGSVAVMFICLLTGVKEEERENQYAQKKSKKRGEIDGERKDRKHRD